MRRRARYPGWPLCPSSLITTSCRGRHIRRSYVGRRDVDKTVFVLDLLECPFRWVFRYIIIICPTIRHNKTYHRRPWIWADPEIFVLDPGERLHDYLRAFYQVFQPASVAPLDTSSDWRPGGRGSNPSRGRQHSFVEIDHEIFSTVILSLPLIQEGQD